MSFYKYWLTGKNLIIPVVCLLLIIGGIIAAAVAPGTGGAIAYMLGLAIIILDCAKSKKRYNEIYGKP